MVGQFEKRHGKVTGLQICSAPWRTSRDDVVAACEASLKRLGRDSMELYQIHFPNAWANEGLLGRARRLLRQRAVRKAVGVSATARTPSGCLEDAGARGIAIEPDPILSAYPFANSNGLKQTCDDLGGKY